ncbi:sulfurtransferase [Mycobacterium sp. C31M]
MTTIPATLIDADAATALREIFADPSLPVRTVLAGPSGERINALREAHDFVSTHNLAAPAVRSPEYTAALLGAFSDISPELASTLRRHAELVPLLDDLAPSRARNALLGDVYRGGLLTWATSVSSWSWYGGQVPSEAAPLQRAEAEFEVDEHPALYDAILLWEPDTSAVIIVPTYRERVTWAPSTAESADGGRRWTVTLSHATFHHDDLIPLTEAPTFRAAQLAPQTNSRTERDDLSTTPTKTNAVTISGKKLLRKIDKGRDVVVLEVRRDTAAGEPRIPGAHPVGVNQHFAGRAGDRTGNAPLPEAADLERAARSWGINHDSLVVVYSPENPAFAARAWWVLRWLGVADVRYLDGGANAWTAAGGALTTELPPIGHGTFEASPGALTPLDPDGAAEVAATGVLIDSRGGEGFSDGHIPGAVRLPAAEAFDADGKFLDDDTIRAQFVAAGVDLDDKGQRVGAYCPVAIVASLSVLTAAKVGIEADLFPGGFSAWLADPARPVATA